MLRFTHPLMTYHTDLNSLGSRYNVYEQKLSFLHYYLKEYNLNSVITNREYLYLIEIYQTFKTITYFGNIPPKHHFLFRKVYSTYYELILEALDYFTDITEEINSVVDLRKSFLMNVNYFYRLYLFKTDSLINDVEMYIALFKEEGNLELLYELEILVEQNVLVVKNMLTNFFILQLEPVSEEECQTNSSISNEGDSNPEMDDIVIKKRSTNPIFLDDDSKTSYNNELYPTEQNVLLLDFDRKEESSYNNMRRLTMGTNTLSQPIILFIFLFVFILLSICCPFILSCKWDSSIYKKVKTSIILFVVSLFLVCVLFLIFSVIKMN